MNNQSIGHTKASLRANLRRQRWGQGVATVFLALALGGCFSPKGVLFEPVDPPLSWPAAPEPAKIHYVGQLQTDKDLKPARSVAQSLVESIFGQEDAQAMLTPYAVCTDGGDRVFVCDSNAQLVHVFDLETRAYEQWKPDGPGGGFSQPIALTYDSRNRLLVSDSAAGVIFVFDDSGTYLGTLGDGVLDRPGGLVADPNSDRIFVADIAAHQVLLLSFDGELIKRLGKRGSEPGAFNYPTNVALDEGGRLYVSDSLNFRVQVFDRELKFVHQIGEKGDLPGYFSHPKGLAFDRDGHLYVIDSHFESVQIFDQSGNLLLSFGQEGHGPGQFWLPTGIHIDAHNRIWIADSYNQRLQVFEYRPEATP